VVAHASRSLGVDHGADQSLEWDLPFAKWFSDGTLNASYTASIDTSKAGNGDKVAYHWVADAEGEGRLDPTYGDFRSWSPRRRTP